MVIPGALYSLLLAVGVWAVDYFTSGGGSTNIIAPIIVAAVPILIQAIMVNIPPDKSTSGHARSLSSEPTKSKAEKFFLG